MLRISRFLISGLTLSALVAFSACNSSSNTSNKSNSSASPESGSLSVEAQGRHSGRHQHGGVVLTGSSIKEVPDVAGTAYCADPINLNQAPAGATEVEPSDLLDHGRSYQLVSSTMHLEYDLSNGEVASANAQTTIAREDQRMGQVNQQVICKDVPSDLDSVNLDGSAKPEDSISAEDGTAEMQRDIEIHLNKNEDELSAQAILNSTNSRFGQPNREADELAAEQHISHSSKYYRLDANSFVMFMHLEIPAKDGSGTIKFSFSFNYKR